MKNHLLKLSILAAVCMVGCSADIVVIDTDKDGYPDASDGCPFDPLKVTPGTCGCGYQEEINRSVIPYTISCRSQLSDFDGDGVPDIFDQCPDDPLKFEPGDCGCGKYDYRDYQNKLTCILATDRDGDGVPDEIDQCPDDRYKAEPKACGCGLYEVLNASSLEKCVYSPDTDQDGMPDFFDDCPLNPYVQQRNPACTCDTLPYVEGDQVTCMPFSSTYVDLCPDDLNKVAPGLCGCGVADEDRDMDGRLDCEQINDGDTCPDDPDKTNPGICGCGVPDIDRDQNGIPDCVEGEYLCPEDSVKTEKSPGVCGCDVEDTDVDQNGIPDCVEVHRRCPEDSVKKGKFPGVCGCDVEDTDVDQDGIWDCMEECPGYPESTFATDSDCDGVLNDKDDCPHNPNRQTLDEHGCLDVDVDVEGSITYTVYSAKDFDTLSKLLPDKPVSAPHARKDRKKSILLARDLNLADLFDVEVGEIEEVIPDCWPEDDPTCKSKVKVCILNPALSDLHTPVFEMPDDVYFGSDDENTARRLYFTARASETDEEVRCNLPHALLGRVQNADIHNLILDFDLDGENVRASLANEVHDSTIENVFFTGTLSAGFGHWHGCSTEGAADAQPCQPLGGLIAEIHGSKIIHSGCKNAVLDASGVEYFGGLAGLIKNTEVDNDGFEHRIKHLTLGKHSAGVAWRIDQSTIRSFKNLIKLIQLNYENGGSDPTFNAGFVLQSDQSAYQNIKNHIYQVEGIDTLPMEFAGFAYTFQDGEVKNLENRIDSCKNNESWVSFSFAGAFFHVVLKPDGLKLTNIINRIRVPDYHYLNEFYGFLNSLEKQDTGGGDDPLPDYPVHVTNLYNVIDYGIYEYGGEDHTLSAVFGSQFQLNLTHVYSFAVMETSYRNPLYTNMLFSNFEPVEDEEAQGTIEDVYFFIPSNISEYAEVGIWSEPLSEEILETPAYAPFKESRVSEMNTDDVIEKLNANAGDTGITWKKVKESYRVKIDYWYENKEYEVPGFELP